MLCGNVADQLLNQNRFTNAGATEQTDLTALGIGGKQVDDLDTGFQNLNDRALIPEGGGCTVDCPVVLGFHRAGLVNGLAQHVEHSAQRCGTHRHLDAGAGCGYFHILGKALCGGQTDAANDAVAHMLCHFHDTLLAVVVHRQCILDHRQLSRKFHIDNRS